MSKQEASVDLVDLHPGLAYLRGRSKAAGKRIDIWTWRHGDTDHVIRIDFRILSPRVRRRCDMATGRIWYLAYRAEKPRIYMSDMDAEQLRIKLFDRLDHLYSIAFEKKLAVSCSLSTASYVTDENQAEIQLSWSEVQIGKRPDGGLISRAGEHERAHEDWPKSHEWAEATSAANRGSVALIDDTPENRQALTELQEVLGLVAEHIGRRMGPLQINKQLPKLPAEIMKAFRLERRLQKKKKKRRGQGWGAALR